MWVAAVHAGTMDNVLASGVVKASTQTVGLSEHILVNAIVRHHR